MVQNLTLFKSGRTGYYYIQWLENGSYRQRSTKCKIKADALIEFRKFNLTSTPRIDVTLSWKDFRIEYEKFSKGFHSSSTNRTVIDGFNSFERYIGNSRELKDISVRDADQYISYLKSKRSVHTARKHYITLSAAFNKAVEWNYLDFNCWHKVKKPKAPQTDAPFIPLDEFQEVLDAIPNEEVRSIVTVAFHTGMRRGEVMSLRWVAIDLNERIINVQNSETFTTKSKKQRSIPMNDQCFKAFQQQRCAQSGSIFVFQVLADFVQHQFKVAVRSVFGKETKLHFHSLRHSFCSNLVRNGADIKVVQSLAGHSSIAVTEKYTHYLRSDAVKAVQLLTNV